MIKVSAHLLNYWKRKIIRCVNIKLEASKPPNGPHAPATLKAFLTGTQTIKETIRYKHAIVQYKKKEGLINPLISSSRIYLSRYVPAFASFRRHSRQCWLPFSIPSWPVSDPSC